MLFQFPLLAPGTETSSSAPESSKDSYSTVSTSLSCDGCVFKCFFGGGLMLRYGFWRGLTS